MTEDEMRALWEAGRPAQEIAALAGRTANSVIGIAHRRSWPPHPSRADRGPPPRTLFERMDGLHARMDAVLAETTQMVGGVRLGIGRVTVPRKHAQ